MVTVTIDLNCKLDHSGQFIVGRILVTLKYDNVEGIIIENSVESTGRVNKSFVIFNL